ncbi:hypothetical protein ACJMK2_002924, partial [Sinanodonta woodiana]
AEGFTWLGAKTGVDRIARYIGGSTIPANSPVWDRAEPSTPNNCIILAYNQNAAALLDEPCGVHISH